MMTQYIRSLDGVRALAVALVMLFHFQLFDAGWIGVQIFFVLSGFLITRILLHEKQHTLGFYLKRFYWRRAVRIFPLYFGYLLLVSLAFLFINVPEATSRWLPYLYTYTYNFTRLSTEWSHSPLFTHFWSLSVEEQFYLLWPFLIYILPEKGLKWALIFIIAAGPLFRYLLGEWLIGSNLSNEAAGEAIYWFTLSHLDAFAVGGAIAFFKIPERIVYPNRLFITTLCIAVAAGFINWYLLSLDGIRQNIHSLSFGVGITHNYQHVWSYTLLNICFAAFTVCLITSNALHKFHPLQVFQHPVMVSIGRVSYGMYIFHWAVMAVYVKIMAPFVGKGWLSFGLYFCLVWLVAWLSYRYYESYFLRLKNRLFNTEKKLTDGKAIANF